MRALPSVLFAGLAVACGSPALPSGAIACGPDGECPDGMSCVRDLCWTDPPPALDAAPTDAVTPDARVLADEHVREAEAYDEILTLGAGAEWTVQNDIADAVGTHVAALPNETVNCLDEPPTDCGEVLVYELPAMVPGIYYFHLRSSAASAMDDSVFYGLDGELIDQAEVPDGVPWAWRRYTLGSLDDEPHALHVWIREDGVSMDRFVVTRSMDSPE